jgi:hypothetical protein
MPKVVVDEALNNLVPIPLLLVPLSERKSINSNKIDNERPHEFCCFCLRWSVKAFRTKGRSDSVVV